MKVSLIVGVAPHSRTDACHYNAQRRPKEHDENIPVYPYGGRLRELYRVKFIRLVMDEFVAAV